MNIRVAIKRSKRLWSGVRFQWECVHPTKDQGQESDDNRRSTGEMSGEDEQDAVILPNRLDDVVEDRRKAERFEDCFHLGIFLADQTDQQDQKPERIESRQKKSLEQR